MHPSGDLSGRTAIVTGGGAGIGHAIALALADAGAHVAIADLDEAAARAAVAEIAERGGPEALAVPADVGDLADIDRMVAATVDRFGRLDVLVNNAGVTRRAYLMDLTEEDFDRMDRVNFKGLFFCLQRAAREMIPRREGVIVNIASIAGRGFAGTSNAVYAATKGAVISLTKSAALQLARHNLNVNAVCPGIVRTALFERIIEVRAEQKGWTLEEAEAEALRGVPLRRGNEPADIANLVVFLASPAARNITAQAINVDGGIIPS